jgi:SAM-dependent methyltransferase
MDPKLLAMKAVRRLRSAGFRTTFRELFIHLRPERLLGWSGKEDAFDSEHGTDTGGVAPLWKFRIDSPNAVFGGKYQSTDEQELADSVHFLSENPHNLTFIDLGCGKGKTLIVAASLGFKQIIGVEFVHELAEIARKNLAKMRIANAVVLETDAANYRPPDSDAVIYLYNPFSQEVMEKVVANLRESRSHKLYVIYKVPNCAAVFDASSFLTRLGCPPERTYIQIWRAARSS